MQSELYQSADTYMLEPHKSTEETFREFIALQAKGFIGEGASCSKGTNYYVIGANAVGIFTNKCRFKVLVDKEDWPKVSNYYWRATSGTGKVPPRVSTDSAGLASVNMTNFIIGNYRRRLEWLNGNHYDLRKENLLTSWDLKNFLKNPEKYLQSIEELKQTLGKRKKYPQENLFTSTRQFDNQGNLSYVGVAINRFRGKIVIKKEIIDKSKNEPFYQVCCPKHHLSNVSHSSLTGPTFYCSRCARYYEINPLRKLDFTPKPEEEELPKIAEPETKPITKEQKDNTLLVQQIRDLLGPVREEVDLMDLDDEALILEQIVKLTSEDYHLNAKQAGELLDFLRFNIHGKDFSTEINMKLKQTAIEYSQMLTRLCELWEET